jgi:hydrogenase nickel incorporation protein HypB
MTRVISIHRDLSASDREHAESFRQAMQDRGTLVVNLMSSPGAGKTSLLVATAERLKNRRRMAVLVGDIATDRDAERLAPWMPAVQLTTGGACHLDHRLVERGYGALAELADPPLDILFIENVGNLVCPSSHDLGEHLRVVLLSTTEGDDKPAKYPKAFRTSQALVISKLDLLPHVPFRVAAAIDDARSIQPNLATLPLSALDGTGLDAWCDYLDQQRSKLSGRNAPTIRPR